MPVWLWVILLTIALAATGYSRYSQKTAIRQRRDELAQRASVEKTQRAED